MALLRSALNAVFFFGLVFLIVVVGAADDIDTPTPVDPAISGTISAGENYREGEVIIGFKPITSRNYRALDSQAMKAHDHIGATVKHDYTAAGLDGVQLVRLPPNLTVASALEFYSEDPSVRYVEPNYRIYPSSVPNDPKFSQQWALRNTGQTLGGQMGIAGSDIDAVKAWDITTGSSSIVVAVVDSGIDYTHPDLAANIWTNPGEVGGNGRDDDGNGYIDDVRGWDFYNNDNNPMDDRSHGTHCAGIIGAVGNNNVGVSGIMRQVRLMPLKIISWDDRCYVSQTVDAFLYARSKGVPIISCSFYFSEYSQTMAQAISGTNALFVCAANNFGTNNDIKPYYPCSYTCPNIIAVAATDNRDRLTSFSNYGVSAVDLAAPGLQILSTVRQADGGYDYYWGTSMATPQVSGVAGLVKARNPGISVSDLRSLILSSVDPLPSLQGKIATGGRLNAYKALGGGLTAPTAAFTATPTSGTAPLAVQFTDASTGSLTSWSWSFGDGSSSTLKNPSHTYSSAGTYTVSLTVSRSGTMSDSEVKNSFVTVMAASPGVAMVPGGINTPTDTDSDRVYDDVNGNGRPDFADVVLYFNQMTWIAGNEPVGLFDYNGNGRVDFADVVWLFNHL